MAAGRHLQGSLDLLLLAVLREGPGHGYAVITRLRDRSDGSFDLAEGTVYPALHKLERAGLISSAWRTASGRRRRVYTLTAAGGHALQEQQAAWRSFAHGMQAVLTGSA
jgi:PadR family transcriptional regulator PadR